MLSALIIVPTTGFGEDREPVFARGGSADTAAVPVSSEASRSLSDSAPEAKRRSFCREVRERTGVVNRQLPVRLGRRGHLGLRQIMTEYTSLGECHVTAQVLIKQNEMVEVMAQRMFDRSSINSGRMAAVKGWLVSGKGVGSVAAEVSRSLLQRPSFARFGEVPFVRLKLNAVLIGDQQVQEFTFPMRSSQGRVSDNQVRRVEYAIVE